MRLKGKVAIISGGGVGIKDQMMGFGGATAWVFAREGASVVIGDINDESGRETVSQIQNDFGKAMYVHLDVTEEQSWIDIIKATVSKFGKLDILVNNAGGRGKSSGPGGRGTVEQTTKEGWEADMALNVTGAFFGTKHAIPEMRKQGGGSIVNIGSISGMGGKTGGSTAYRVGKAGVQLFTKATAIQYAEENIRANCVHPGYFVTPMTRNMDEESINMHLSKSPTGRFGNVEDIAHGVLYLASDEASFVTGADLIIDGGVTAQE